MFDEVEYEEEIEEEDVRVLYQLHYNNWSSHTCPFPISILQFRRRVSIYMNEVLKDEGEERVGPVTVHCSDGCGRTGAYLCIDANLELAEEDGLYDVYAYARKLKHSRRGLIENIVSSQGKGFQIRTDIDVCRNSTALCTTSSRRRTFAARPTFPPVNWHSKSSKSHTRMYSSSRMNINSSTK